MTSPSVPVFDSVRPAPPRRTGLLDGPPEEAFDRALAALGEPARAPLARRLLNRYAPGQLEAEASAEMWREWLRKNRPYLFFSDAGGYRWYLDPLAKRRGIPSERLRGPARATLPALQGG